MAEPNRVRLLIQQPNFELAAKELGISQGALRAWLRRNPDVLKHVAEALLAEYVRAAHWLLRESHASPVNAEFLRNLELAAREPWAVAYARKRGILLDAD